MSKVQRVTTPVRKKCSVGGVEKELFMSFAAHQKILALCGGLENVVESFSNPYRQMECVLTLIMGRDLPDYKTPEDLYDLCEELELGMDEAAEIMDWIQSFIVDFTFAQVRNLSEKYEKGSAQIRESLAEQEKASTLISNGSKS